MKMLQITGLTGQVADIDRDWRPMTQKSVMDRSNVKFIRTIQLSEQGLIVVQGKNVALVPMGELLALVETLCPVLRPPVVVEPVVATPEPTPA